MREYYRKIKSISVAMLMLLAAFTASILMVRNIAEAAEEPTPFAITAPAEDAIANGIVNITWNAPSANASGYIVQIDGTEVANITSGTTTYYNWNTFFNRSNFDLDHKHIINVSAYNDTQYNTTYSNNTINVTVQGTPGVDLWEYANTSLVTKVGAVDSINTSTASLKYGVTKDIKVTNASVNWAAATNYYLYYPVYEGKVSGSVTYVLSWARYKGTTGGTDDPVIRPSTGDLTFGNLDERDVTLNRSGLWVIAPTNYENTINVSTASYMDDTVAAWLWVNTSMTYGISASDDDFDYDTSGYITINVSGAETEEALVAIYYDYDSKMTPRGADWYGQNKQVDDDNELDVWANSSSFLSAGNYTYIAYWDVDGLIGSGNQVTYKEGDTYYKYYNASRYGHYSKTPNIANQASQYNFTYCGPWDPPEYNSTGRQIIVDTAEPTIRLYNSTQYYGFDGRLEVNVTDADGDSILALNVTIVNESGTFPGVYFGDDTVAPYGDYKANSHIDANWTKGEKGTWEVVVANSTGGDSTEEWNVSAYFEVEGAPGLQIKVMDDGDGDNDLEVIGGPPDIDEIDGTTGPAYWTINFTVVNDTHHSYGNDVAGDGSEAQAMKNITISGDACLLSGKTLEQLDEIGDGMVTRKGDYWEVNLIPRMDTAADGGGKITISAKWKDHGGTADPVDIILGGDEYNGTLVDISPSEITIDKNITLKVTVTDPEYPTQGYKGERVYLYYINDSGGLDYTFNNTLTTNWDGEATFHYNRTQQTDNQSNVDGWTTFKAPRYIVAYVDVGNNKYGYGYAKLVPSHDFEPTVEAWDSGLASTSTLMAGRDYDKMYFNVSIVDSSGNVTGYPKIGTGQNELHFRIYNDTGEDVTDDIGASFTSGDLDITSGNANHSTGKSNNYVRKPGIYSVYVYNNTYDSEGRNATLEVKAIDVTSSIEEFIWIYDDNISTIFTVKYEGGFINGTLRIDNVTDEGDYNKTWANCSFNYMTETDDNLQNTSLELTKAKGLENGVVTVFNITALYLPADDAIRNITFFFKSDKANSKYAPATGRVPVKIPDVTPTPSSLAFDEAAELEILLTGRGTPLDDLLVNISVPSLDEMWSRTGTDGIALFAFTPPTTGDITIEVENRTSNVKVPVTSYKLYLDVDPEVDEATTLTVTVLNKTASGAAIAGVAVTFNRKTETTDSVGQVEFTSPSVTSDREFTIVAKKAGYAEARETVYIVNKPKLVVVPPAEAAAGSTFQVTIADDLGNAIIGASVSIGGGTSVLSGAQGIATLTAPKTEGITTITAVKTGFQTSDPAEINITPGGVPGFEVLTLIAAIGVAFILLRRRRH